MTTAYPETDPYWSYMAWSDRRNALLKQDVPWTVETLKQAIVLLEEVVKVGHDDESAHSFEDSIHERVLRSIAEDSDCPYSKRLAALALETGSYEFHRWYA